MLDPVDPDPDGAAMHAGCTLCRLLWGCLVASWRIYKGPAVWDRFPRGVAFAVLSLTLATVLYGLMGWVQHADWGVALLNAGLLLLMGIGPILYREDLQWVSSMLFVMSLGILAAMPLDVLTRLLASSPIWGGADHITRTLSTLVGVWMTITIFRLAIAKIKATNKKYPLK